MLRPSRTNLAASQRTSGVTWFSAPSSSSAPHLPQLQKRSKYSRYSSGVGAVRSARPMFSTCRKRLHGATLVVCLWSEHETAVPIARHVVADLSVTPHAADVGQEHTGLALHVGAEVPGVAPGGEDRPDGRLRHMLHPPLLGGLVGIERRHPFGL